MLKIGVLASGGGTNLQAVLDAVKGGTIRGAAVAAVVSDRVGAFALERARKNGAETAVITKRDFKGKGGGAYETALADYFNERGVRLVLLAGFNTILAPAFLERFGGRVMNIHPSLIPSFCGKGFYGLVPHEAVLARGCKVTGATVHFVNDEVDGGEIVAQKAVDVMPDDTPEKLQRRVMEEAEWVIYPKAVAWFADKYNAEC